MNYREAKLLKSGDEVVRAWDKVPMVIHEATAFGQYKKVKLICYLKGDEKQEKLYYYNDDVEEKVIT